MTKANTGGPAFPKTPFVEFGTPQNGMTLRDYFAAKAMQGWLSTYPTSCSIDEVDPSGLSKWSYEMADDMLKARGQA